MAVIFPLYKLLDAGKDKLDDSSYLVDASEDSFLTSATYVSLNHGSIGHENVESGKETNKIHINLCKYLLKFPSQSLWLEMWWREALYGSHGPGISALDYTNQHDRSNSHNEIVLIEEMNPGSQYRYVKADLCRCGAVAGCVTANISVPKYLDETTISTSILKYLISVICLTSSKEELGCILKPIILSEYTSLYMRYLLSIHDGLAEIILPIIFDIVSESMAKDPALYWKFRLLSLELSTSSSYGLILRDLLMESDFQELSMDITITHLNDLVEVVHSLVPNNPNVDLLQHKQLSYLSIVTVEMMLTRVVGSFFTFINAVDDLDDAEIETRVHVLVRVLIITLQLWTRHRPDQSLPIISTYASDFISAIIYSLLEKFTLRGNSLQYTLLFHAKSLAFIRLVSLSSNPVTSSDHERESACMWNIVDKIMKREKEYLLNTEARDSKELMDSLRSHDLYFKLAATYRDSYLVRGMCLGEMELNRIDTIIPLSSSGWITMGNKLNERYFSSTNYNSSYFLNQFNSISRPSSICGDLEVACDWTNCLEAMLRHNILIEHPDLFHDLVLDTISNARFPLHVKIHDIVDIWVDRSVKRVKYKGLESVLCRPLPLTQFEANRLLDPFFQSYNFSKFDDLVSSSSVNKVCRTCLKYKSRRLNSYCDEIFRDRIGSLPSDSTAHITSSGILTYENALRVITRDAFILSDSLCKCLDDVSHSDSNLAALPGILALYAAMKYIIQIREVSGSYPALFEIDMTSVPCRRIIQALCLPSIFTTNDGRKLLDEVLFMLHSISPELFLADRVHALTISSSYGVIKSKFPSLDVDNMRFDEVLSNSYPGTLARLIGVSTKDLNRAASLKLLPSIINRSIPEDVTSLTKLLEIHQIHQTPQAYEVHIINYLFEQSKTQSRVITSYFKLVQEPILIFLIDDSLLLNDQILSMLLFFLRGTLAASSTVAAEVTRIRKRISLNRDFHMITKCPTRVDLQNQVDPNLFLILQDVMICKALLALWSSYLKSSHVISSNNNSKEGREKDGMTNLCCQRAKQEIIRMIKWMRDRNSGFVRALITFDAIEHPEDWALVASTPILVYDLVDVLLMYYPTHKIQSLTTKQFYRALSNGLNFVKNIDTRDDNEDNGIGECKLRIISAMVSFLIEGSSFHVSVFHSISHNENIDRIALEILDILVIISPKQAMQLFKIIFMSTEGYALKRFKDALRLKYAEMNVTNTEEFVVNVLKLDPGKLMDGENQEIDVNQVQTIDKSDGKLVGRKRAYSHGD